MSEVKDWRGTPINIGDTVIYGSGVGRSIQMNEAIVESFGKEPKREGDIRRVNLRITRRSYMSGSKEVVSVGADRLTIVSELPPTELPTQSEANELAEARTKLRGERKATHENLPISDYPYSNTYNYSQSGAWRAAYDEYYRTEKISREHGCIKCGASYQNQYNVFCDEYKELNPND